MFSELWNDEIVEGYEKHNLESLTLMYFFFFLITLYILYSAKFWLLIVVYIYSYYRKKRNRNLNQLHNYILTSEKTFLKRFFNS